MAFQVSIFLENKIGHFEQVTGVLKDEEINIRTMMLTHTANGWGILNLVVSDPQKAYTALTKRNLSAALREIMVLPMNDAPGGLDTLLKKLSAVGINFTNAYGRVVNNEKNAYLVIDVEDIENAKTKLEQAGVIPVSDQVVYGI